MAATSSHDEKTRRITKAVRLLLARKGYAATTITEIAQEAGLSRGLLHYYFKSKEEMLARTARENVLMGIRLARTIFEGFNPGQDLATLMCRGYREFVRKQPDFFNVFFESWALARQSPLIHREMASLYAEYREALEEGLTGLIQRRLIEPRLPIGGVAALLAAIFDGFGLQLMSEPHLIDREDIWQSMEACLRDILGGC